VEGALALAPILIFFFSILYLFIYQYQKSQFDITIFNAFRQTQIDLPFNASGTPQFHLAGTVYNYLSSNGTVVSPSDIQICKGPFSTPVCCTLGDLQSMIVPTVCQPPIFNEMIVLKVSGQALWAQSQYMFFLAS
jgi:hypothetical protein